MEYNNMNDEEIFNIFKYVIGLRNIDYDNISSRYRILKSIIKLNCNWINTSVTSIAISIISLLYIAIAMICIFIIQGQWIDLSYSIFIIIYHIIILIYINHYIDKMISKYRSSLRLDIKRQYKRLLVYLMNKNRVEFTYYSIKSFDEHLSIIGKTHTDNFESKKSITYSILTSIFVTVLMTLFINIISSNILLLTNNEKSDSINSFIINIIVLLFIIIFVSIFIILFSKYSNYDYIMSYIISYIRYIITYGLMYNMNTMSSMSIINVNCKGFKYNRLHKLSCHKLTIYYVISGIQLICYIIFTIGLFNNNISIINNNILISYLLQLINIIILLNYLCNHQYIHYSYKMKYFYIFQILDVFSLALYIFCINLSLLSPIMILSIIYILLYCKLIIKED